MFIGFLDPFMSATRFSSVAFCAILREQMRLLNKRIKFFMTGRFLKEARRLKN
jgi:hypothetical protein